MKYTDAIFYDAGGHTGFEYYIRFVAAGSSKEVKYIWDDVNEELVASPMWDDSAIDLIEIGETGAYPVEIPDKLPTGKRYDVIVYKKAGSFPVNTDDVEKQYSLSHGSIFGF